MMNYRCIQLINYLLLYDKPITIQELSEVFSVSRRTIQYDIDKIDDWLECNNLSLLKRDKNGSIGFTKDKAFRKKLVKLCKELDFSEYACSPKERQQIIMLGIFFYLNNKYTLLELSEKLCVSKMTVYNDIAIIKNNLLEYEIIVIYSTKKGYHLKGKEQKIREAYFDLFCDIYKDYIEAGEGRIIWNTNNLNKFENGGNPFNMIKYIDMTYISECLLNQQKKFNISLTDKSFVYLCIKLAIQITRIKNGFLIKLKDSGSYEANKKSEFKLAKSIAEKFELNYKTEFSSDEIMQLALDIMGAKIQIFNMRKDIDLLSKSGIVTNEALIISNEIANEVGNKWGIDIDNDKDLIINLSIHITSLLHRLRYNLIQEENPIIEDFKVSFPEIFEVSKIAVIKILKRYVNKDVKDDEIGFIAMHLGSVLCKKTNIVPNNKEVKVIIVCGTGLGTAKLLETQIKNEFDTIEIVDIIPYYLFKKNLCKYSYDFIISTISLDDMGIEYILINSILNDDDITRLAKFFNKSPGKINNPNMLKLVIDEVSKLTKLDYMDRIQVEINVLKQITKKKASSNSIGVEFPRLNDFLKKETIVLNRSISTWEDSIRCAGLPLLQLGYITEKYIESAIKYKRDLGGHIIIGKGVAFPHALPEDGVNRVCFSLLTLTEPVCFGNNPNDQIDVVIMMATTNSWIHVEALSDLVLLIKNDSALDSIRHAMNPDEVIKTIEQLK